MAEIAAFLALISTDVACSFLLFAYAELLPACAYIIAIGLGPIAPKLDASTPHCHFASRYSTPPAPDAHPAGAPRGYPSGSRLEARSTRRATDDESRSEEHTSELQLQSNLV